MYELFLMRHAKSDWHLNVADIDRPLNRRGKKDATLMGKVLRKLDCLPECIIVSPARRTQETVERMSAKWSLKPGRIITDNELYMASGETIIEIGAAWLSKYQRVMLVAHNPGMDSAVSHLADTPPEMTASGKLMVTAAIAHFSVTDPARLEQRGKCHLLRLLRPKDIQ